VEPLFEWYKQQLGDWDYSKMNAFLNGLEAFAVHDDNWQHHLDILTMMMDRRYDAGNMRRSSLLSMIDQAFSRSVEAIKNSPPEGFIFQQAGDQIPEPNNEDQVILIDARAYTPQDDTSVAREVQRLFESGFKRFIIAHSKGHRFIANGLGPGTSGVRIDVYGSPGDYLASGLDGLEIHVHNNGQDQLAQIMKSGKLVVHGDVGQTFMYAAKGGEVYVLGNSAGRPLINAVGKPRVVINGTCLDYLAESFMAGDPLNGGGFVILNGLTFDEHNNLIDLDTPYPGGNLFSLASGGAIYLRDPHGLVTEEQLNGGEFTNFSQQDWQLIEPYLQENARLFDISLANLLTVDGIERPPGEAYRKIHPRAMHAMLAEEAWVTKVEE
jgi:glutamate synthase domain-containing protein 3